MQTQYIIDTELDYYVAKARGYVLEPYSSGFRMRDKENNVVGFIGPSGATVLWKYHPSSNWQQGGPIVEFERIAVEPVYNLRTGELIEWTSKSIKYIYPMEGPTPLVAAMRAYVANAFGLEVPNLPDTY